MNSIRIEIRSTPEKQEELIALLSDLPVSGFEETPEALVAWFRESDFQQEQLASLLQGEVYDVTTVKEVNWNEEWEKNFQPVIVDDFCAVRASFHDPIPGVTHEIIITPKMSFGTGHHATTFLMMREMASVDFRDKKVFDFGTGTGILAILAEKLGAKAIKAIDIDEWSVRNALENVKENGCRHIAVSQSTAIPAEKYDVVLANINRNVILQYLPALKDALLPGGLILFSGLLTSDEDELTTEVKKTGLELIHRAERSNWICLVFCN